MTEPVARLPVACPHCGGHKTLTIVIDNTAVSRRLARIERALGAIIRNEGIIMTELDDRLDDLQATEDSNTAALARLIADFEGAGNLTDDQRAKLDALKQHIVDNQAAIDAADPAPAPPAETPEPPASGDGSDAGA